MFKVQRECVINSSKIQNINLIKKLLIQVVLIKLHSIVNKIYFGNCLVLIWEKEMEWNE